jgi:hypothetical protein
MLFFVQTDPLADQTAVRNIPIERLKAADSRCLITTIPKLENKLRQAIEDQPEIYLNPFLYQARQWL